MADLTLTEALHRLHAAGRIVRRWLPGMLLVDTLGRTARYTGFAAPEATLVGHRTMEASQAQPVLTDPATVGCLLALLREAGLTNAHCAHLPRQGWVVWFYRPRRADEMEASTTELRMVPFPEGYRDRGHPTEGEALAAALIALAEGL